MELTKEDSADFIARLLDATQLTIHFDHSNADGIPQAPMISTVDIAGLATLIDTTDDWCLAPVAPVQGPFGWAPLIEGTKLPLYHHLDF